MSNQRIGYSGTVLKERINSPSIKKTSAGDEITESFNCNRADAEAAITARGYTFGDSYPDAPYTDSKLKEINIAKDGPQNAEVTYIWRPTDPNEPHPPVGTVILESDSNVIEVPIGQNPNASGTNYNKNKKVGIGDWEGIEAFLSPQPLFSRREVLNSFTFSEANIIENVAKIHTGAQMNAKGMSSASDGKWLKMQKSVATSGSNFEVTERWQYAENGWNTDLYDAAS